MLNFNANTLIQDRYRLITPKNINFFLGGKYGLLLIC